MSGYLTNVCVGHKVWRYPKAKKKSYPTYNVPRSKVKVLHHTHQQQSARRPSEVWLFGFLSKIFQTKNLFDKKYANYPDHAKQGAFLLLKSNPLSLCVNCVRKIKGLWWKFEPFRIWQKMPPKHHWQIFSWVFHQSVIHSRPVATQTKWSGQSSLF